MGEFQLDILQSRLNKKTPVRFSPPVVKYRERLIISGIQVWNHRVSLYGNTLDLKFEIKTHFKKQSALNNLALPNYEDIIQSAFYQITQKGPMGKGHLVGLSIVLQEAYYNTSKPLAIPLIYKGVYDALRLFIARCSCYVQEPWMNLQVEIPYQYCGVILADLEKKKAKILNKQETENKIKIISQILLSKTFGYSILLRSMSQGHGTFKLSFDSYLGSNSVN